MATASYLYHTLGLTRYSHERTEFLEGAVYYHVRKRKEARQCAHCGARWIDLVMNGAFTRVFHALPVGRRKWCRCCGRNLRFCVKAPRPRPGIVVAADGLLHKGPQQSERPHNRAATDRP